MWWGPRVPNLIHTALLPTGNIAWMQNGVMAEHRFDGSLVRTYDTVGPPNDFHDLAVLPNGNHVMATVTRQQGNLSSWGGPANVPIINHVVQEITPAGAVVWSWDTACHIPLSETTAQWRAAELADPGGASGDAYDPYHYNSVEPTGDGYILSFRHLDAIYKVDKASGNIVWKLGGTAHPRRLSILNDPASVDRGGTGIFGGQHDARLLADGTVTLYDNGTGRSRPPRAVRYRLDLGNRTATLVRAITNLSVPGSFCCGSARALASGHHVIDWGGSPKFSPDFVETTALGTPVFSLFLPDSLAYRTYPVPFGQLSRTVLRAGMDARYPQ